MFVDRSHRWVHAWLGSYGADCGWVWQYCPCPVNKSLVNPRAYTQCLCKRHKWLTMYSVCIYITIAFIFRVVRFVNVHIYHVVHEYDIHFNQFNIWGECTCILWIYAIYRMRCAIWEYLECMECVHIYRLPTPNLLVASLSGLLFTESVTSDVDRWSVTRREKIPFVCFNRATEGIINFNSHTNYCDTVECLSNYVYAYTYI